MWVEFVVGSLPCSKRFFSWYSGFPLSLKTITSKFQFNLERTDTNFIMLLRIHFSSSKSTQGIWVGSLASIRGKRWPWGVGHFTTLAISAYQMPGCVLGGWGGGCWGLYWLVHYFGINFTLLFSGIAGHLFFEDMTWINEILFYIYEGPSTFLGWHLTYLNARIQEIRTGILKKRVGYRIMSILIKWDCGTDV